MSVGDNPTTIVFRPAPEPGMLDAGSKGVAMNKLTCCVAVAVAGLGGQEASDWNLGFWEGRYTRVRKARR